MNDAMDDRIAALEEAQELLREAVGLVKQAVCGTHLDGGARAYVIPSLLMCIDDDHGYLGRQPYHLAELIQTLGDDEDEYEDYDA